MIAVTDRAWVELRKFPGLEFSDEQFDRIVRLISEHEAAYERRLRSYRVLNGKGDAQRAKDATSEAERIKLAATDLCRLISGNGVSGIDWADALHTQCIVDKFSGSNGLGAGLSFDDWRMQLVQMLESFSALGAARADYYSEIPEHETALPRQVTANFAYCLACHYTLAGGRFGQKTGVAGFPAFLKRIWPLVPLTRRQTNDTTFARELGSAISDEAKSDISDSTAARLEYIIAIMAPR